MTDLADPSALGNGEIHVWRAFQPVSSDAYESLAQTLDEDERARAARFAFEPNRVAFTFARGVLRWLLARYCARDASRIRFSYGKFGKPALADNGSGLRFNVSHSGDVMACAFARQQEIGVDVERLRADLGCTEIAHRFFAAEESELLLALPPESQLAAFFRCWTRKEAFIKARGDGLSFPLKSFAVSLVPGDEPRLISILGDPKLAAAWTLQDIPVPSGYAAAIAVEGRDWKISTYDWNDFLGVN